MQKITTVETKIVGLSSSVTGQLVLNLMIEHYRIEDILHNTKHYDIINEIYFKRTCRYCWKLANHFNISDNALLRYIKLYVEFIPEICFYTLKKLCFTVNHLIIV